MAHRAVRRDDGGMRFALLVLSAALALQPAAAGGQEVEQVRASSPDAPGLPEDLFRLPPGHWAFGRQLWQGDDPCTAEACEAGYTSGDLAVSVERSKKHVRIVAGFRGCPNVAWNEYEIGDKASGRDTKTVRKRLKQTIATSAKYCKMPAPTVAELDTARLFPVASAAKP